ncbi:fungal-specific transcription factor domain-containing protein [Mycena galopus ATCC 62051]|nr:fungal-specific transcription factor domain-containing protein [Mycena galopus ATCC 62051]
MSWYDEEYEKDFHRKKRRVQRACDFCRRRKSDGAQMPGNKCTTCLTANIECTYVENPVFRPPSYIDSLESRLEHSEALVRKLRAELADIHFASTSSDFTPLKQALGSSDEIEEKNTDDLEHREGLDASLCVVRRTLDVLGGPPPPPHADDLLHLALAENFRKISLNMQIHPFLGKSSGTALVKAAIDVKEQVKREECEDALILSTEPLWDDQIKRDNGEDERWTSRRSQYWTWKQWKNVACRTYTFKFPSEDFMKELVELYFTRQHIYYPLLHRPTFERGITEKLHLRDNGFAVTVLLVCAIGSRWSMNPSMAAKGLACGWEWFDQVPQVVDPLFGQAGLYDLQYYCLAAQFLSGSSGPQVCWTLIGIGLRLAQDIGVHRRQAPIEVPTVERELFKRAFWVLVCLDRIMSAGMGRACAMQYEDFDLDHPIEVDDDYWEHPTHPFMQPAGVPSRITYFNTFIRLNHILAFSLKTLYSLSKMPKLFSSNEDWDEHAVPELDSALNNWLEQIPHHLRWDPTRKDPVFFAQSVSLQCWFHSLRILIHRPLFMRKSSPTGLPSLVICTYAARTCANILDVQRQRNGNVPIIFNLPTAFTSAIILLLVILSGKRAGLVADSSRDMANVYRCMEVVRLCEGRWQSAGVMWDILAELASVGRLTLPKSFPKDNESTATDEAQNRSAQSRALYALGGKPTSVAGSHGGPSTPEGMEPSIFAPTPAPDMWSPLDHTFSDSYTNAVQATPELVDMLDALDGDTIAMWTNAPVGLQPDDWGTYFSNFSEITQTLETSGRYAAS